MARTPVTTAKAKIRSDPDKCALMLPPAAKEKPKSETYKQAWSVSEQRLERLLSEIPDGEKNQFERLFINGLRT